jgi:hypothetical protein
LKQFVKKPVVLLSATLMAAVLVACGGGGSSSGSDSGSASASDTSGGSTSTSSGFGTYDKPFTADSPWNSYPVDPVLGDATIPTDSYFPRIAGGSYSSMFAEASSSDDARTIYAVDGSSINLVYGTTDSVTLPHWPSSATPASGSDGHLDIYDPTTGIIHSFWKLTLATSGTHAGEYTATQYTWTKIDGRGWGDPARYYQGARATGVPTVAGMIRTSEVDDGDTMYRHALAMSLTYSGLSASPTFQFPATAADSDAASTNTGSIPEGALVMLPSSFDESQITNAKLLKVVKTLKTYGARVVDRNTGTPFVIYVEGVTDTYGLCASYSDYTNSWSNTCGNELQLVRAALRPLSSQSGWVDGNGSSFTAFSTKLRMVAGRGSVYKSNLTTCAYDAINDRVTVVSGANGTNTCVLQETLPSGVTPVWTKGKSYNFTVTASSDDIKASLSVLATDGTASTSSVGNGETGTVTLPYDPWSISRITISVPDNTTGWVHVSAVEQ